MILSRARRRMIATLATASLIGGSSLLAGPALGAPTPSHPAPATGGVTKLPTPNPHYQMPKIPIWVSIGSKTLGNVTLTVRNPRGTVISTAKTNPGGVALVPRSSLKGGVSIAVTGGAAWERLGRPTIETGELIGNRNAVIVMSPFTSIAHKVAKARGTSYVKALVRAKKALRVPEFAGPIEFSAMDIVFDYSRLQAWSKRNGGWNPALDRLAARIADGKPVPNFTAGTRRQLRDVEVPAVEWVGEQLMSGILSGSGSKGASIVIGDLFGQSDPTSTELGDINSDLRQIITELQAIEATLQQLVLIMEETSFQVLNSGMADLVGAVNGNGTSTGLWAVYLSATTLNPSSTSYEDDLSGFQASFYNGIYSILPSEVGELFDTPTSPGLLHQIYNFNTAPWWNSTDVASVSSIIDYYGTVQAQAVALLNEAWWGPNSMYSESADDINTYNTVNYSPQNSDIYLSMPTQIDDSQIALPKSQMVYQAFPISIHTAYQQKTGNLADELPTCSNDGQTVATEVPYPPVDNNSSHWDDTWVSAMPSGWTVQGTSILNSLDEARKLPNSSGKTVSTYTLSNFVQGVPNAFALVTSGQYPRAGYAAMNQNAQPGSPLAEWMFCYNSGVPLDNLSNWQTNFEAVSAGEDVWGATWGSKHVPAGAPTNWIELPIPVGVIGAQKGSFAYVPPPPPPTSSTD